MTARLLGDLVAVGFWVVFATYLLHVLIEQSKEDHHR